jgi:proteasome lid subunit RPN8/RPN11
MIQAFRITAKHYQTILKQGRDNYPEEVGGFLGGNDGLITGILPLFNKHLYNKTDTFSFTSEDMTRAHEFCAKHGLQYYGLYHTHPKGIAYPSKEDIATGHKYHFILSLREDSNPIFKAFFIDNRVPFELPFSIVEDKGFFSKDLQQSSPSSKKITKEVDPAHNIHPAFKGKNPDEERHSLNEKIGNMLDRKENAYEKMPPKDVGNSDFSTLA